MTKDLLIDDYSSDVLECLGNIYKLYALFDTKVFSVFNVQFFSNFKIKIFLGALSCIKISFLVNKIVVK